MKNSDAFCSKKCLFTDILVLFLETSQNYKIKNKNLIYYVLHIVLVIPRTRTSFTNVGLTYFELGALKIC